MRFCGAFRASEQLSCPKERAQPDGVPREQLYVPGALFVRPALEAGLFADGVHVSVRLGEDKRLCLLVVIGVREGGRKGAALRRGRLPP
jgi:hypothetical protein